MDVFRKYLILGSLAFLLIVLPVGCLQTKKEISYTGSSTIGENIIPEAFRVFSQKTGVEIGSIENPGSGKGVEAVLQGTAEMAGVSRPLLGREKKENLYHKIIGYDAIGVFIHQGNPVNNLTKEQIKNIFTGKIRNWKAVGGWDAPIVVITEILGEERATMLEFQKLALDGEEYLPNRVEVDRPAEQATVLENEINGIINVSIAFDRPGIKPVSIDGAIPDTRNIRSNAYLLSRPLLLITNGKPKGIIKDFFNFMISSKGQSIVERNFVPIK